MKYRWEGPGGHLGETKKELVGSYHQAPSGSPERGSAVKLERQRLASASALEVTVCHLASDRACRTRPKHRFPYTP